MVLHKKIKKRFNKTTKRAKKTANRAVKTASKTGSSAVGGATNLIGGGTSSAAGLFGGSAPGGIGDLFGGGGLGDLLGGGGLGGLFGSFDKIIPVAVGGGLIYIGLSANSNIIKGVMIGSGSALLLDNFEVIQISDNITETALIGALGGGGVSLGFDLLKQL